MPAKAPERHNHLPDAAYAMPGDWSGAMTAKQLRETIAATDGWIMACGYQWDVMSKRLGGGMVRVWLVKR